jgi:hypothetical protein
MPRNRGKSVAVPGPWGGFNGTELSAVCPVADSVILNVEPGAGTDSLLRLALKCLDFASKLPKLYVVAVNQLRSVLFRRVVIIAEEINRSDKMAVITNNVRSIFGHRARSPSWPSYGAQNAKCQFGTGHSSPGHR